MIGSLCIHCCPHITAHTSSLHDSRCQGSFPVLQEHVKSGKVKGIGLSEIAPADVERAAKVHPITCIEVSSSQAGPVVPSDHLDSDSHVTEQSV